MSFAIDAVQTRDFSLSSFFWRLLVWCLLIITSKVFVADAHLIAAGLYSNIIVVVYHACILRYA